MRNKHDTPLLAASIRRVRKGVYDIKLYHPSGRPYGIDGVERFFGKDIAEARAMCKRLYPSTIFLPKGTPKSKYHQYAFGEPDWSEGIVIMDEFRKHSGE